MECSSDEVSTKHVRLGDDCSFEDSGQTSSLVAIMFARRCGRCHRCRASSQPSSYALACSGGSPCPAFASWVRCASGASPLVEPGAEQHVLVLRGSPLAETSVQAKEWLLWALVPAQAARLPLNCCTSVCSELVSSLVASCISCLNGYGAPARIPSLLVATVGPDPNTRRAIICRECDKQQLFRTL